jgi:hypothetical protein
MSLTLSRLRRREVVEDLHEHERGARQMPGQREREDDAAEQAKPEQPRFWAASSMERSMLRSAPRD